MTDDASLESQPPAPRAEESGPIAKIDKALPKGWRMRLAKAAAQLIAGSEKGAVAYGEIRERLDTIEGRSLVSKKIAEAVAQQALDDPEIMERAKARFLGSTLQKQENLEAVIAGAAQPLLALPPPVQQQDAASAQTDPNGPDIETESPSEPLNADWAATFTSLAENATTDELRSRLSRVLAGELKAPGTYSRSTIRQIAELEKTDLEAMQSVLNLIVGDMILRFGFGENQEPGIDKLLPLLEAGLVAEAGNMLNKTWLPASADNTQIWFGGRSSIIRVTQKAGQSFSVPMTQLTRTGVAVVDLLGRFDEEPILLRFVDSLDPSAFEIVEIGRLIDANRVSLPLRLVRPLPAPTNIVTSGPFRFSP